MGGNYCNYIVNDPLCYCEILLNEKVKKTLKKNNKIYTIQLELFLKPKKITF